MGGGYEYFETEVKGGSLTVAACVSNGASRHAMPTIPELVYAALLYHDESPENENFEPGTQTNGEDGNVKLVFSFQRPEDTRGTFTLEVFAFIKSDIVAEDGTTNFSRNGALLSGKKDGCAIEGDAINVSEPIELSSSEQGTVSLKIKVPDDCTLKIDDTTSDDESRFNVTGTSPNFIVTQKDASGISAGAYQVKFTVKKGDEIVHIFSEYINVINGLCTDTWGGSEKGAAKEISQSMISSTVYVRGTGGWYDGSDYKDSATANDDNLGSFLSPLATIQKAIDKIIAINDGSSAYTIYVDGTLTATDTTYIGTNGMADFSAFNENLTLTIKPLSSTATLDAGARLDSDGTATVEGIGKRVIYARPASGTLNLTLENLTITGGNSSEGEFGGGIYVSGGTLNMKNCKVEENITKSYRGGGIYVRNGDTVIMDGGTISRNKVGGASADDKNSGGGIYVSSSKFTMRGAAIISENILADTAYRYGGNVYISSSTFEMESGTISGGNGAYGGGVFVSSSCTFTMDGGTISENNAQVGGGVYVSGGGAFMMKGGTISDCTAKYGGGVYVTGSENTFTMEGGTISGNTATYGGGVYGGTNNFTMNGGTISGCNATCGGGIFVRTSITITMNGGTISGNNATDGGNGVFFDIASKLNMSGTAKVENGNDIFFNGTASKISITGDLTAATPVATITPSAYTANRQVLTAGDGVTLDGSICSKFAVTPQADGTEWRVALDGADGVLIRKYEMGDTGPGGGAVCYYDPNGFTVNGKTCHYFECSKETIGLSVWCPCTSSGWCNVTTSFVIGAGYANTQAILDHPNHASATAADCAAKLCANYSTSTTNVGEWFLPNNNEAYKIYKGVSIISSEDIWSSQGGDANTAWSVKLRSTGSSSVGTIKNSACSVRAMRAF